MTSGVKLEKFQHLYILMTEREAHAIFQELIIGGYRPLYCRLSIFRNSLPLLPSSLSQI